MFHFVFFNDTATTEIYTLSLHDALPICLPAGLNQETFRRSEDPVVLGELGERHRAGRAGQPVLWRQDDQDRKSTRLNSSHANISYAVFCLKKKILTILRSKNKRCL